MENYSKKYNVTVNRIGLKTWLFTGNSQASIENVKNDLIYNNVSFKSKEVFIDNAYGMEVTVTRGIVNLKGTLIVITDIHSSTM